MNRGGGPDPEHKESDREIIDYLLTAAHYLTGNKSDAEDLVSDLLLKLLMSPGPTNPVRNPKPFLKTSLARLFIDNILRPKRPILAENLPDLASPDPGPEEQAIDKELLSSFWKEVGTLNEMHREVLRLRFCYTLSVQRTHSEIATELGIPVGTVGRRLHDALEILRRRLSGGMGSGQGYER